MGGWASISLFCSGRAGGRRDFVVENRVGVGGRPGTPGPVGGPVAIPSFLITIPSAPMAILLTLRNDPFLFIFDPFSSIGVTFC